jgi:hypothetical protein
MLEQAIDYQRAAVALLRALQADDWQAAQAILDSTDAVALLLAIAAMFNSVGQREAGGVEEWDAYLLARLDDLPTN